MNMKLSHDGQFNYFIYIASQLCGRVLSKDYCDCNAFQITQ